MTSPEQHENVCNETFLQKAVNIAMDIAIPVGNIATNIHDSILGTHTREMTKEEMLEPKSGLPIAGIIKPKDGKCI